MKKWEQARIDKKPFKPSAKSILKYEVRGDIEQDSTLEVITQVREKSEQQNETLKKGSYFPSKSFFHAL